MSFAGPSHLRRARHAIAGMIVAAGLLAAACGSTSSGDGAAPGGAAPLSRGAAHGPPSSGCARAPAEPVSPGAMCARRIEP